jgi:glycosyltransferase involved in cell wall biosynthesis
MSRFSNRITFVLFTFNEEKRIERAILNFIPFGHILVVDNESTDATREIAQRHGCEILVNKNPGWVEDEITVSRVKAAVTTEWIYWAFADEMVEADTVEAIFSAIESGRYDIVNVARKNYYYGQFCYDLFADRMNRVFKKDTIDFTGNKIHCFGQVVPGSRICTIPGNHFVHHFISNTAKAYLHVMDRYTDTESMEERVAPSLTRLLLSGCKTFLLNVFVRRGYRGGMPAYFLVANMIYYRWLSGMKLYERKQGLDRTVIESKNDSVRDRILKALR